QMVVPADTVCPISTASPVTVPSLCAVSGCSIFIASSTTTVSPADTRSPSPATILTIVPCIGLVSASLPPPAAFFAPPGSGRAAPACGAGAGRTAEPAGPPHAGALAARSHDDPPPRAGPARAARAGRGRCSRGPGLLVRLRGERRDLGGELGFDPSRVHRERL